MPKLTKSLIEKTLPGEKDIILRDTDVTGFLCKITPTGRRVYMLYYRTRGGQERRPAIGRHGQITCEQARETAKLWLAEVVRGSDPSKSRKELRSSITVTELFDLYLAARSSHLKASSKKELTRLWERYINPALGGIKALHLDSADIRRFHERNAHRPYTANRMLEAIRCVYNFAIDNKMLAMHLNPCAGIKKYKEKKRERFLALDEMTQLSAVLRDAEVKRTQNAGVIATIRLLLLTGCRLGEILNLRWNHVDFQQSCLRLPDSKTGAKIVYLSDEAVAILDNLPRADGNSHVIVGGCKDGSLAPPQKAWRRIRNDAGLPDVRLHDLRHSFASVGAANNLSLPIIGALLGHSQSQTTERYAHLIGDPMRAAANVIGNRIAQAMAGNVIPIKPVKARKSGA